jgi:plasmid stability protein
MATVTIHDLDDEVVDALQRRAGRHDHSLEEEIRELLGRAAESGRATLSHAEFLDLADRIRAMTPKGVRQTDSADIVRELRDRR